MMAVTALRMLSMSDLMARVSDSSSWSLSMMSERSMGSGSASLPCSALISFTASTRESLRDLRDEAEAVITAEFAPRDRYLAIVNAISDGRTSLKEISERADLDKAMCLRCLDELTEVGVVDTVHPMMGAPKRPVYRIADSMVAFCQDVVMASKAMPFDAPGRKYARLEQRIRSFLGDRFEDLCADYVTRHWDCLEIGRWWGPDESRQMRELDIAATVLEGDVKVSLFGDCRFIKDEYTAGTLRAFRRTVALTKDDRTQRLVLFAVPGFDAEVVDEARMGYVTLVGLDELAGNGGGSGGCRTSTP